MSAHPRRPLLVALLLPALVAVSCTVPDPVTTPTTTTSAPTTPTTQVVAPGSGLERTAALDRLGIPDLSRAQGPVVFQTGFESITDVGPSYITPQSDATRHELTTELVHSGAHAHKGWLTGIPPSAPEVNGPNHRGYPTVQLHKMGGGCQGPCLVELWVWLDVSLRPGQWFSLGTFTADSSDQWNPVVTVNVGSEGTLSTFHVPRTGLAEREFQTDMAFPMRQWVRVTTYIDLRANGSIATWQDGRLTSAARVEGGTGTLEQAHFGLYAPPDLLQGRVYNDDLTIWHLDV